MIVKFRDNTLKNLYLKKNYAFKTLGAQVAKKYIQRINIIQAVENLDGLIQLPALRCHPLKGNRKGQYAINLTGFYRLIFTVEGNMLNIAMIEEVSKHYDD